MPKTFKKIINPTVFFLFFFLILSLLFIIDNNIKEAKAQIEVTAIIRPDCENKIPIHKKHWPTIVNSFIYGNYPILSITQAIKFGGKTVHPEIPFSAWQKAKDYLEWIGK